MNEDRETAYFYVFGWLGLILAVFFVALVFRQPNPKVTMTLTNPSPTQSNSR